jgi:hypothetical protein
MAGADSQHVFLYDGVQWKLEDGTILTRRSDEDPWDLWQPDETGPSPPPEFIADEAEPARRPNRLWLAPAGFVAAAIAYLISGVWLDFDPAAKLFGSGTLLMQINFVAFRIGVVIFGLISVGLMVLIYQRFLDGDE